MKEASYKDVCCAIHSTGSTTASNTGTEEQRGGAGVEGRGIMDGCSVVFRISISQDRYSKIQICFAVMNCILKIIHFAFSVMKNKLKKKNLGVVTYTCNHSTQEAEKGQLL